MAAHKKNQYAAKHKGYDAKLHIDIIESEKIDYKAYTKSKGLTLTDWVNNALRERLERDKEL
jgi:hypothetical protein